MDQYDVNASMHISSVLITNFNLLSQVDLFTEIFAVNVLQ